MDKKLLREYLAYYQEMSQRWLGIDLYWNEYLIWKRLYEILVYIKNNNYSYRVSDFPGTDLEKDLMLNILINFCYIEYWTSNRQWWIEKESINMFDLLLLLLEKDYTIINLTLEVDKNSAEEYNPEDNEQINYLQTLLNNPSVN